MQGGFEAIYDQSVNDVLGGTGKETFEAVNYLKKVNPGTVSNPKTARSIRALPFGNSLLQIAQLMKAGVGLEVAFTDIGRLGHACEPGKLARPARQFDLQHFSNGIAALATDLGQADGRCRDLNDVGIWSHRAREWQSRH